MGVLDRLEHELVASVESRIRRLRSIESGHGKISSDDVYRAFSGMNELSAFLFQQLRNSWKEDNDDKQRKGKDCIL